MSSAGPEGCGKRPACDPRHNGIPQAALNAGHWNAGGVTEAIMTVQTFSPSLFAPAQEADTQTYWLQLLDAIVEERQRMTDAHVADDLRGSWRGYSDELCSALERRPLQRQQGCV
jgi:hypothetical protein